MKKKLSGMTLVEVITAVAIIFLVSAAAYAGICTAGKFMVRGADIRAEAEKSAENLDKELRKEDFDIAQTTAVTYVILSMSESETVTLGSALVDIYKVNSGTEVYSYAYYRPCVTEVPKENEEPENPEETEE